MRVIALLATVAAAARVPTPAKQHSVALTQHLVSKSQQPPAQQQQLPEHCTQAMQKMREPEFAKKAAKCEKEGKYPEKAIAALQKRDEKAAEGAIEELFTKCAQLPKDCAAKIAPDLVTNLRFSGAAVSEECAKKMEEVQTDEAKAKQMQDCDKKEHLTEDVLAALNKGDLDKAINSAESGLEKCMDLDKTCSYQIAPVLVNSVVMRAMLEQGQQQQQQEIPQTTVLVAQPVIVVEEPVMVVEEEPVMITDAPAPKALAAGKPAAKAAAKIAAKPASKPAAKITVLAKQAAKTKKPVSLLALAAQSRPLAHRRLRRGTAPALIQEGSHHYTVSKLIVQLARQQRA